MKTKIFIKAFFAILILFISIKCEDVPDAVPRKRTYDINTSYTVLNGTITPWRAFTVEEGDSVNYKIYPGTNCLLYCIRINGVEQLVYDTLIKNFCIKNIKSDMDIFFGLIPSYAVTLSGDPWYIKNSYVYQRGVFKHKSTLDEDKLTSKFYYHLSGYSNDSLVNFHYDYPVNETGFYEVCHANGEQYFKGGWTVSSKGKLYYGDNVPHGILELTDNLFVTLDSLIVVSASTDGSMVYEKGYYSIDSFYRPTPKPIESF